MKTSEQASTDQSLLAENAELRARLEEAEEMLRAIRAGEVDALVVEGDNGPRLYILQGVDAEQNRVRGEMLAQISDAVIAVDLDERITFLNAAAERRHGVRASGVLGRKLSEIYTRHWPSPEREAAAWAAVREQGEWHGEYLQRTHDGRELHVDSTLTALRDEEGETIGHLTAVRDITERKRAEESVARLAAIVESSHDAIVSKDLRGTITSWNHGAETIFGYSAEEIVGQSILRLIPPERHDEEADILARVGRGEDVRHFETVRLRKDGSTFEVSITVSPVKDASGTIVGISKVAHDITDRRRVEAALRENAALFSTLIAQAPMGTYVVDAQFRMKQVNAEAMPAFANVQPLIGRDFQEVLEILWGPELGAQIAGVFRHTLETGERYVSPPFTEKRHDLGIEQCYEWETQRVTLPDGQHGVVCYFHEVTERARATEALRASEQRMRLATEATGVGIWEWNVLTNQVRWDAEMFRIYGIAPTSDGIVDYTDWSGAVVPEDLAENEAILQDTLRRCGQSTRTFRIRRRNGECRTVVAVETVRTNALGQAEWVVGTNLDITERKRAEEELRRLASELSEADRRKDEFLATLAHELRNPLAPIRNGLEIMAMSHDDGENVAQVRTMMQRQVAQIVHLVDDLLDVSRISRGKLVLRKQRIELADVVNHAVDTSRPVIEANAHELTVMMPNDPVFLEADETRLGQVISNLLNNAAKYSPRGGRTWLTAEVQDKHVVVSVKDTGIGIAADMLPKIFDMFTQVDRSLEKSQGGLGIGLCLVKRLVELHGGSIEVKSEGQGKGSEFTVRLPILASQESAQSQDDNVILKDCGQKRILIVDDNLDSALSLSMMIRLKGHDTQTAHDGLAAVQVAEQYRPEIVLLDIGLPKMNGYDACRCIREQPWSRGMIIVAVTGWGQDEDRRRSSEAGFDRHLVKPIDLTSLDELLAGIGTPIPSSETRIVDRDSRAQPEELSKC